MKRILSLASFVCAILFAAAGMMMPPQGEISGSVLILVAQLLILCATFLGIKDYHNIINRKLWLKILKTSGASSSTLLWPPSPPCSRPLVSPSGDTPSRKPMNRPVWFVGVFLSTDHTENTEISLKAIVQIEKEAVFTYGLFYNKININHCTIDFINNYNYLRCKYTNNNDMFQIFWALFFLGCHRNRSMTPSPSVTVWQFDSFQKRFCVSNNR